MATNSGVEVAKAWVTIIPTVQGAQQTINTELSSAAESAGTEAGEKAGESFTTSFGAKLTAAGAVLTATVTNALVSVGKTSVETAVDFENSMSQVSAALGDVSMDMSSLEELAQELGASTIFSANEAAEAMVELAKGGLTEADIAGGALSATMDLAAAGSLELADAANTVVQAMGAFGLEAGDTTQIANALAGAANASSTDVSELTYGLSQCAASASNAGWSIQDTTAALAMFADAGITGSDAGTSLKTMLQRLSAPTDDAAAVMAELGIEVYDTDGNFKSMSEIAEILQSSLYNLDDATQAAALSTIFGSDATRAATVFMNEGAEGLSAYVEATNDQESASRMAEAALGDVGTALEQMNGALETAQLAIGDALAPLITAFATAIDEVATAFTELDPEMQTAIVTIGLVVAAIGPIATVAGLGMTGIGNLVSKLKTIKTTADMTSVATAIDDIGTKSTTSTSKVGKLTSALGDIATTAVGIGLVTDAVGSLGNSIMGITGDASDELNETVESITSSLDTLEEQAVEFTDSNMEMWAQLNSDTNSSQTENQGLWERFQLFIADTFDSYGTRASESLAELVNECDLQTTAAWLAAQAATVSGGTALDEATASNVETIIETFEDLPDVYSDVADTSMQALASGLAAYIPELADTSDMTADQIIQTIREKLLGESGTEATATEAAQALADGLVITEPTVTSAAQDVADAVTDSTASLPSDLASTGSEAGSDLASSISSQTSAVSSAAGSLRDATTSALASTPSTLSSAGSSAGSGFASGVASATSSTSNAASSLASATTAAASNNGNASWWGQELGQNFASGISSMWSNVKNAASSLASAVSSFLHFSEPDEGPLSDFNESGFELGANFAEGIYGSVGDVRSAALEMAEAASLSWQPVDALAGSKVADASWSSLMSVKQAFDSETWADYDGGDVTNVQVGQLVVREEADIERISRELYRLSHRKAGTSA